MCIRDRCVDESERKSIQVEGLQGVNFSHDVVVGGEEKASRVYLGDIWSANSCPLIFVHLIGGAVIKL